MKRIILFCLILLSSWGYYAFSKPVLVFSTVDDFPPFNYMKDGALSGIDIDLVQEMANRLNLEVKIVSTAWKSVMLQVEAGRVDGGFAAFLTPQRQEFSLYTAPLHYEAMHLFVNKENAFSFSSLSDLDGKVIAKESGAFISDAFQKAMEQHKFRVNEGKNINNLKMLDLQRVDGVIGHLEVMQYYLGTLNLSHKIAPIASIGNKQAAYLILSKKSKYPNLKQLQQEITRVLEKMQKDGTYQRIVDNHVMNNLH
ncbi:substrate-binding periplasmic protein [Dongshaea marina]|uniref:substrate-binding periplasmic protein n=1 Tax=Dongshaea marina TaxID=2047966 RepID=UPI00131EE1D4|nr:ABC transporter substrate-binding protein [Dongshaea marina]